MTRTLNRSVLMAARHNIWIHGDLWRRAERAARLASVQEDQRVSVAELVRRGLELEIAKYPTDDRGKS